MPAVSALIFVGLLTLFCLLAQVLYTYYYYGLAYGWSANRSTDKELDQLGVRIRNTLQNQVETIAFAAPVLAAAAILQVSSEAITLAAFIHVIARACFIAFYYSGIPYTRLPAWAIGWMAIAYIAYELLMTGAL